MPRWYGTRIFASAFAVSVRSVLVASVLLIVLLYGSPVRSSGIENELKKFNEVLLQFAGRSLSQFALDAYRNSFSAAIDSAVIDSDARGPGFLAAVVRCSVAKMQLKIGGASGGYQPGPDADKANMANTIFGIQSECAKEVCGKFSLRSGCKRTERSKFAGSSETPAPVGNNHSLQEHQPKQAVGDQALREAVDYLVRGGDRYRFQFEYKAAEAAYRSALHLIRRSHHDEVHESAVEVRFLLSLVLVGQGRYGEAEQILQRATDILQQLADPNDILSAQIYAGLANTQNHQGNFESSQNSAKRAISLASPHEETRPEFYRDVVGGAYLEIAESLRRMHRPFETVRNAFEKSRQLLEGHGRPADLQLAEVYNGLAGLYYTHRMTAEATAALKKSMSISEAVAGPDNPDLMVRLGNLARIYRDQGDAQEAEAVNRRQLRIAKMELGEITPDVANAYADLGQSLRAQGRFKEAVESLKSATTITKAVYGGISAPLLGHVMSLADLYRITGQLEKARASAQEATLMLQALGMKNSPRDRDLLSLKSRIAFSASNWLQSFRIARNALHDLSPLFKPSAELAGSKFGASVELSDERTGLISYWVALKAAARSSIMNDWRSEEFNQAFEMAQIAETIAASEAVHQMSSRLVSRDPHIRNLVRKRQDLAKRWRGLDSSLLFALALKKHQSKNSFAARLSEQLDTIGREITAVDTELMAGGSREADLTGLAPASIAEVQAWLKASEVLVLLFPTMQIDDEVDETLIWIVTETDAKFLRSPRGHQELTKDLVALRCGLDLAVGWKEDRKTKRFFGRNTTCASLAPKGIAEQKDLPFNAGLAFEIFQSYFGGEAKKIMENKSLLVVPSGPLTELPFHALVMEKPEKQFSSSTSDLKNIKWMGARQAITILPSVSSLKALRRDAKRSAASKPYFGIGNPALKGRSSDDAHQKVRKYASEWAWCGAPDLAKVCRQNFPQTIVSAPPQDPLKILEWSPLPQTACELCAIGARLKSEDLTNDILLSSRATEAEVKRLGKVAKGEERSQLQNYRIIHFATHGAVTDAALGYSEPGLILTPPEVGHETADNDGYLGASEVADLKLDADWVIMSACNTASGSGQNAEAFSGLARVSTPERM